MQTPSSAPILRTEALRAIEAADQAHQLMERAGAAGVALAQKICKSRGRPILIIAGPGNNGGDALVIARLLHQRAIACHLVLAGDDGKLPADAQKAWQKFLSAGGTVYQDFAAEQAWDLVIDGLFGLGLSREISGDFATLIARMQTAAAQSACPLLALDCPSGLDSETGTRRGACIEASHTITFLGLKPGLLTNDGPDVCGDIVVADLGVAMPDGKNDRRIGYRIGHEDFRTLLVPRRRNSNKGSYGAAGVLGGAPGMLGAALLAGRAALKLGAGRVYLGLLDPNAPAVDPIQPELMLRRADDLLSAPLTALAAGPGFGTDPAALTHLIAAIKLAIPLVLDADALNLLATDPMLVELVAQRPLPTVLTPHPGEAARLLAISVDEVQADRLTAAFRLAERFKAWVVLKGCGSIVVSPKGDWWINSSGNPGLASAGTGDTLTGFIVGLLAQGHEAGAALIAAVHLHGAAADVLAAEFGMIGLSASELPDEARRLLNQWIAAE